MEIKLRANPSGLEDHLGYWLRRISNQVSGSFARSLLERQTSAAEWVLVRLLFDQQESTPGALAATLGMTRGAVSKVVDKLQAKAWVASRVKPEDNRVQLLSLTRQGRRVLPELAAIADQNDDRFFHCLTRAEKSDLLRILSKLADFHQIQDIPVE